ncbi:hypothetical protein [Streptomyces sp. NPDC051079]
MVKAPLTYLPQITNSAEVAGGTPDPGPGNDAVTINTRPNRPTPRG